MHSMHPSSSSTLDKGWKGSVSKHTAILLDGRWFMLRGHPTSLSTGVVLIRGPWSVDDGARGGRSDMAVDAQGGRSATMDNAPLMFPKRETGLRQKLPEGVCQYDCK
ncbi:hypothetical protein CF335_g4689 [Tilletia laevis]|nr:hypothetical protein CF335_g4689 [Tilletia laevis]